MPKCCVVLSPFVDLSVVKGTGEIDARTGRVDEEWKVNKFDYLLPE